MRFAIALLIPLSLSAWLLGIAAAAADRPPEREAPASEESLVAVGRDLKRTTRERMQAGEPLTPAFKLGTCEWSRRLCVAELAIAPDKMSRVRAVEDHLGTVIGMVDAVIGSEGRDDAVAPLLYRQLRFLEEEAKLWVVRAKADKPIGAAER